MRLKLYRPMTFPRPIGFKNPHLKIKIITYVKNRPPPFTWQKNENLSHSMNTDQAEIAVFSCVFFLLNTFENKY